MRTTITIDEELLKEAHALTGITARPDLIRTAIETLIAQEKAQKLATLGGTEPDLTPIPRRRSA